MELSLPTKLTTEKRRYQHFSIDSVPVRENIISGKAALFYVGHSSPQLDLLLKAFDGSHVVESVKAAISFLDRFLAKQSAPDMIIVDGRLGSQAIKRLATWLSSSAFYISVPLLVDTSNLLSESEIKAFKKDSFVDEIISVKAISKEKLVAKAGFLKKVKTTNSLNSKLLKQQIQFSADSFTISPIVKRLFDIVISGIALVALSPVFLVIGLLIKFSSKGPVFYISPRAGRGYKIFNFYKFRTMVVDADKKVEQLSHLNQYNKAEGAMFFKVSNDPRITKIGAFLRNTSLDELPQLLNVFLGHMSLVGNRPLPLYEAATLTTNEYAARFMAPAGITGLWQIKKRGDSNMSVEERINLDIAYAHKYNFVYDLWIMAKTPTALLQKENV